MELIVGIIIGAFLGWNLPQPSWAQTLQSKIVDLLRRRS